MKTLTPLDDPSTRIETESVAVRRIEELCVRLVELRNTLLVGIPGNPTATRKIQQKAEQHLMMTFGQAVGALRAFRQCGLLPKAKYCALRLKVMATLQGESKLPVSLSRNVLPRKLSALELRTHVEGICHMVTYYRERCDVVIHDDPVTKAKEQLSAWRTWNAHYGEAIGTLISYRQASKVEDVLFDTLRLLVQASLAPKVVGTARGLIQPSRGMQLV